LSALGLGAVAALQPCALAGYAAALPLLASPGARRRIRPLHAASLFVAGSGAALAAVAAVLGSSPQWTGAMLLWLPRVARSFLPALLIVAGMLQIGLFRSARGAPVVAAAPRGMSGWGSGGTGPFLAGAAFSMAFCPATAGLFFGALLPLSFAHGHPIAHALAYAAGFGAPLLAVAAALAAGLPAGALERRTRSIATAAGWILVGLGAWLTWRLL
jgi:hypothetical protein